jgi:hypothetical protein
MIEVRSHARKGDYSIDGDRALQLRRFGLSLAEIREKLNPDVSIATVSRSIRRALEANQRAGQ